MYAFWVSKKNNPGLRDSNQSKRLLLGSAALWTASIFIISRCGTKNVERFRWKRNSWICANSLRSLLAKSNPFGRALLHESILSFLFLFFFFFLNFLRQHCSE